MDAIHDLLVFQENESGNRLDFVRLAEIRKLFRFNLRRGWGKRKEGKREEGKERGGK